MDEIHSRTFRVALVWRGDGAPRAGATAETSRLAAIFRALRAEGFAATPCVFDEAVAGDVRAQILAADAVLVWVDPLSAGRRRTVLDALLREAEAAGVFVSARPDVILTMGVKSVLWRTRELSWGSDVWLYETPAELLAQFPGRVASGPRVLKLDRANGGQGVWKVQAAGALVTVQEARPQTPVRTLALADFMAERVGDFADGGLVDQAFQPRHLEGMVRCYMSGERLVGFGHQYVRALAAPEDGPASPRLYSGPDDPRFQHLRVKMEREWTPGMARLLDIDADDLPAIWDADLLLGPRGAGGEDTHVLCEINASSVFPIPDEAAVELARTLRARLDLRRPARER